MIKIIRRGENAPSRRVECHNCGCVFEYQKSDMQMLCNGGAFQMHLIQCPQCGQNFRIPEWDNEATGVLDADSDAVSELKLMKRWCDERASVHECMECPLNDECTRMFAYMSPNMWQDKDIETWEKEIRK